MNESMLDDNKLIGKTMRDVTLERHQNIDGLFVVVLDCVRIYFQYVGYDSSEKNLIFERNQEIVTARLRVDTPAQLEEWERALNQMGVELERLDE